MKIRDDNYYTVKGWMINRLGLKGTQLLLYAIIYGFSQDGQSVFKGSVGYLAEFTGVSEVSARSNLNALVDRGLINKYAGASGDVNSYAVNIERIMPDCEEHINMPAEPKKAVTEQYSSDTEEITAYLNKRTGKNYKAKAYETYKPIQARLREGFSVDDFKKVIDNKCADWKGDAKMDKYLRPQTLFGTKFQAYLNQKPSKCETHEQSYDLEAVKQKGIMPIVYERKAK